MVANPSTASRAIDVASATFLAGRRVKMQELADALAVTRMTLHRAVGTRTQLLGAMLWQLSEPEIRAARAAVGGHGPAALAASLGSFVAAGMQVAPLRAFMEREPAEALAVLTTGRSGFQANVVALVAGLLEAEARDGHLELVLAAEDLAYAAVRLLESFTYTDLLTGGTPDPVKAERAVLALLS